MKRNLSSPPNSAAKAGAWGVFFRRRGPRRDTSPPPRRLGRLVLTGGLTLLGLYGLAVTAGYVWTHHVRKNEQITFADVALLRWKSVRRGIAAEQFAKAKSEWEAKNYKAAHLAFSSGLRNDPDNIPGRLSAAAFLVAVGGTGMAAELLEDGLARAPDHRPLIQQTFDLLISTGRDRRALELLRQSSGLKFAGPHGALLRTYEIHATLNAEGAAVARKLLEGHSELLGAQSSALVVARVLWESRERLKAIDVLAKYLGNEPGVYPAYTQLVQWQLTAGITDDARRTAERACAQFPRAIAPRVLLIEAVAARSVIGQEFNRAIGAYLRDFSGSHEALLLLAELAGRKGWLDLNRILYELGAVRQEDLKTLALYYADSLARNSRLAEARALLAQIEAQTPEYSAVFFTLLRQRQILIMSAMGDREGIRNAARRLAVNLRSDSDGLEAVRQRFAKLGIAEAVAELSRGSLAEKSSGPKG